jgi:hypothetical protein
MVVKGPSDSPQPMPSGAKPLVRGKGDEFNGRELDRDRWSIFNERSDRYLLADGALVITPQGGEVREMRADMRNIFLTYPPPGETDFSVRTRVRFAPQRAGEQAFLCLWQSHNDFVRLAVTRDEQGARKFQIASERAGEWSASEFDDKAGDDVLLRIDRVEGSVRFHVSGDGGKTWEVLSKPTKLNLPDPRVGIGATIGSTWSGPGPSREVSNNQASFDFVHFDSLDPSASTADQHPTKPNARAPG